MRRLSVSDIVSSVFVKYKNIFWGVKSNKIEKTSMSKNIMNVIILSIKYDYHPYDLLLNYSMMKVLK